MVDIYNNGLTIAQPVVTYQSSSYTINGGTALAAGASVTETMTFTGLATTDVNYGFAPRDAIVIPKGLVLVSSLPTATNTLTVTWKNTNGAVMAMPAAGVWGLSIFKPMYR
jgi:hypothetical protein